MQTIQILLQTLSDTEKLGNILGRSAKPGDVICLNGDLGAGKTALAQAIARGLEVPEECYVTSPSFALLHEYPGRLPMFHMDFYRLQDAGEIIDLGFEEYFYRDGLSVIEWSNRAEEILPDERVTLYIVQNPDHSRIIKMQGSPGFAALLQSVSREFL